MRRHESPLIHQPKNPEGGAAPTGPLADTHIFLDDVPDQIKGILTGLQLQDVVALSIFGLVSAKRLPCRSSHIGHT